LGAGGRMREKYLNLFTDYGFKKLFGEEDSKEQLMAFLNTLLPAKHHIESLSFTHNEKLGVTPLDRGAIYDLNCISASGEHFIVELQKAKQAFFKDRSVFYATFPIQQQAEKGDWNFKLNAVYTIGILDFEFDEDKQAGKRDVVHTVQLKNQRNEVFFDKCTFIYLTMPNFEKTETELETDQDKWLFLFKNLHKLQTVPARLQHKIFERIFEKAQIAKFDPQERESYESSLKHYRDMSNVIDTAREEGREEGLEEGLEKGREEGLKKGRLLAKMEIARNLLDVLDNDTIALKTGLTPEQVQALRA
jgi:predicted transposase/invertase (TIGR01784 family)